MSRPEDLLFPLAARQRDAETTVLAPVIYSGDLRPFPGIPSSWPTAKRTRAYEVLQDVEAALGSLPEEVPGADHEDFWEDACRLSAAWRTSGGDFTQHGYGKSASTDPRDHVLYAPDTQSWSDEDLARRLGPVSRAEEGYHAEDRFAAHPVLLAHGGLERSMTLLTIPAESEDTEPEDTGLDDAERVPTTPAQDDLFAWMVSRAEAGIERVVIKSTSRKNGLWVLDTSTDYETCRENAEDSLDWTLVRLAGMPAALIGQDLIDMRWEYRCFVVDGEVVTAAGCIEEDTPLDRSIGEGPFQSRLREFRGHLQEESSLIAYRPAVTERLLEFARQAASEHGGTVVIDVAIDAARDVPVIVELNDLPNSGLYASDPWLVHEHLAVARDRGYAQPRQSQSAPTSMAAVLLWARPAQK